MTCFSHNCSSVLMTQKEEMEHEKSLIKEKMKDLVVQILNSSINSTDCQVKLFSRNEVNRLSRRPQFFLLLALKTEERAKSKQVTVVGTQSR